MQTHAGRWVGALAGAVVIAVALAIVIVPAELLFRAKNGAWYAQARAAPEGPIGGDDFRLYRSPFSIAKKPGRTRVLVIGGSTTYGVGVEAEQTWPCRLAHRLEETHPGRFEIVDVSYLGGHLEGFISDFRQASHRYISRERWVEGARPGPDDLSAWGWRDLDADIVVVAPVVNDTAPDYALMRKRGSANGWSRRLERLLESTSVIRSLAVSYYVGVLLQKLPRQDATFDVSSAIREVGVSYKDSLERFIALWKPTQPVVVIGLPWLFNEGDSPEAILLAMEVWGVVDRGELLDEAAYFPKLEHLEIRMRAEARKDLAGRTLVFSEVAPSLKTRPFPQRLRFYVDAVHATAAGHQLFAADMHDLIVKTTAELQRE